MLVFYAFWVGYVDGDVSDWSFFTLLVVYSWIVGSSTKVNKKSFRYEEVSVRMIVFYAFGGVQVNGGTVHQSK